MLVLPLVPVTPKAFGVTGTKGKTSIAYGLHRFFLLLGLPSVYIGTLGVCYGRGLHENSNTTPGLFQLIEILQEASCNISIN